MKTCRSFQWLSIMSQTLSNCCSTRLQNFEIYFRKKLASFQAFYKLIRHLVNLSKNLQAFLCLLKLSRDISDAPGCFPECWQSPRLISQTSPRTLKDPRRILRILSGHPGTPEDSLKLPPDQSIAETRRGRMLAAISHVALIYRSR